MSELWLNLGSLWTTTSEWKACQWRTGCKLIDFPKLKIMFASANTETLEQTTVHETLDLWKDYLHCACHTILKAVKNPRTVGSLWLRKFHMEEFVTFIMGVILLCEATCGLCTNIIVFKPMPCYVWTLVVFKVFVDQHRQRECWSVENRLQTDRFPTEWKPVYMHTPTHLSVPQWVELSTFGLNNLKISSVLCSELLL